MSVAADAWLDERLPMVTAVTFSDDRMILLSVQRYSHGITDVSAIAEATVQSFLEFNPETWTYVGTFAETVLDSGDRLLAGEADHGSFGFVALSDASRALRFSVFFEDSNPFVSVALSPDGAWIVARNNLDEEWRFKFASPWIVEVSRSVS